MRARLRTSSASPDYRDESRLTLLLPQLLHSRYKLKSTPREIFAAKARWCRGQAWRALAPLTAVRIRSGLYLCIPGVAAFRKTHLRLEDTLSTFSTFSRNSVGRAGDRAKTSPAYGTLLVFGRESRSGRAPRRHPSSQRMQTPRR